VLSAASGISFRERWVYFALIANWTAEEGGTNVEVQPT
jgi:hypothetical protein